MEGRVGGMGRVVLGWPGSGCEVNNNGDVLAWAQVQRQVAQANETDLIA